MGYSARRRPEADAVAVSTPIRTATQPHVPAPYPGAAGLVVLLPACASSTPCMLDRDVDRTSSVVSSARMSKMVRLMRANVREAPILQPRCASSPRHRHARARTWLRCRTACHAPPHALQRAPRGPRTSAATPRRPGCSGASVHERKPRAHIVFLQSILPTNDPQKNQTIVLPANERLRSIASNAAIAGYTTFLDLYPAFIDAKGRQITTYFNDG